MNPGPATSAARIPAAAWSSRPTSSSGLRLGGLGVAPASGVVGDVEPAPLEDEPGATGQLPDGGGAAPGARRHRLVGHLLEALELVAAVGAAILVRRHRAA